MALVARVTAFLVKRLFVEGSQGKKKDDLLYLLEQPPFQAQVDANMPQWNSWRHNTERRAGARTGAGPPENASGTQSTLDSALAAERALAAQIAGARAQLRQSEINLGYTEIRAPIDGKISSAAVTEGNVVSPTTGTLATLVSQDPMYVIFSISQRTGIDCATATPQGAALAQS